MKKILFVALAALGLSACDSEPKFKVEGEISGADGKMLYLEASALEGIVPLDSVKLKGNGTFAFKQTRPVSPEFYRLRVDDKVINFSIDSTETVRLNAPYTDFSTAYRRGIGQQCEDKRTYHETNAAANQCECVDSEHAGA